MDARFYNSEDIDIERLAIDVSNVYLAQGYQAQHFGDKNQVLVQIKKGGDFEAILGMQAALSLTLQHTAGGTLAMIGQQKWLDKAAVGAVGIVALPVLWPLALTAGYGALRQASLGNQVLNVVDGLVRQQRPSISAGPIPVQIMPQLQQHYGQPPASNTPYIPPAPVVNALPAPAPVQAPAPAKLRCQYCNTPYEPGDTFCSGCGRSLAPAKQYCTNCHFELKPGASFCPKCGTSTFQQNASSQPAQSAQAAPPVYTPPTPPPAVPTYTPPPAPVQPDPVVYYTPPKQETPVYTPPAQPQTPVYTPPPTPVYTPPPADSEPFGAPTVAAQPTPPAPAKEPEPYYVPPTTQTPSVVPQPKVTYVPSNTPKQEETPPPQRPQKQYYIPSNQAQATAEQQQPVKVQQPAQVPPPPKPIAARPASGKAADPNTVWGTLTFNNGIEVSLKGERVVVGRYDHDLGGIQPDVDLSKMQGADTASRIHAQIEHIGSTYTVTDLNSTNATRLNGKRLEPDKATPLNDGDTVEFGKITSTFKRAS